MKHDFFLKWKNSYLIAKNSFVGETTFDSFKYLWDKIILKYCLEWALEKLIQGIKQKELSSSHIIWDALHDLVPFVQF